MGLVAEAAAVGTEGFFAEGCVEGFAQGLVEGLAAEGYAGFERPTALTSEGQPSNYEFATRARAPRCGGAVAEACRAHTAVRHLLRASRGPCATRSESRARV